MNKLATAGVATLLCGGLVAGTQITTSEAATAKKTAKVSVKDDFFTPKTVRIKRNGTVTWTWRGSAPHDVKGSGFRSKVQTRGTYKRKYTRTGSFRYICTIHSGMAGTVKVVR